ncbi:hypothetical protein VPH35_047989 [Triticum aestivum]
MKLLPAVLGLALLLLVLNPNGVEARPAPTGGHEKKSHGNGLTPTAPTTSMPMGFRDRIPRPATSQTTRSSRISSINAYIGKVTKEMAANVEQLLKLGVTKVLVNNLHPVGCTPSQTRTNNYTTCDIFENLGASIHNNNLKQVMTAKKNQFKRKLSPCCESLDSKGYCGQQGELSRELLYTMCNKSNKFFYWDDMHPTHVGWEAVMKQLEKPLRVFLDQD